MYEKVIHSQVHTQLHSSLPLVNSNRKKKLNECKFLFAKIACDQSVLLLIYMKVFKVDVCVCAFGKVDVCLILKNCHYFLK